MASTIQIRVDDDLKNKSDQLFKDLGTDTTSAIRMFLTQAVAYNGFPFEIKRTVHNPYTSMTEEEMLQRLEQSRESSKKGNYRNADDVISDMRGNMDYKVVVTAEAEEDLNQFIQYLLFAKKNKQAAKNVLDDFEDTIKKLKYVASSLNVCDNPRLQSLGYRRINFQQHRYFMLYRIENDVVYVDDIFHELQDYENRMI